MPPWLWNGKLETARRVGNPQLTKHSDAPSSSSRAGSRAGPPARRSTGASALEGQRRRRQLRRVELVVFGLTISTSWGNGHATLWRALASALSRLGHSVTFFERDLPYYAPHRDLFQLAGGRLRLYRQWEEALPEARGALAACDLAMVTSYCPDGEAAGELVASSRAPRKVFYDMDTPVTLERARQGRPVGYIGPRGLRDYDRALSFTRGGPLSAPRALLGPPRPPPPHRAAGSSRPPTPCGEEHLPKRLSF